ncbi:MAG: hypothetical protein H0U74_22300 [Bradymonadaceae bacterium]|nr:hypothetical protein [Lujinxingiaceae bacterium]
MAPRPTTCSAPGKLFLFGEYAVLSGGQAIVTAVDRRVFATRHMAASVYRAHGTEGLALPRLVLEAVESTARVEHLETDVRALFDGPNKLGLGSSAASTVALCAAVLAYEAEGKLDRDAVFRASFAAHCRLQRGRGSGGDVACSTYGGTLAYSMSEPWRPLQTPQALELRAIWTGESASSTALVDCVEQARKARPAEIERALSAIADVADQASDAIEDAAWSELIALFALGDDAMERLGIASEAPIITARHRALRTLAGRYGAVVKPSGAGGGDFSLAVGEQVDWEGFAQELPNGCQLMDLALGAHGVRVAQRLSER